MKQVIVMRKDLNLRKGKMVAQGGHAALTALIGDIDLERLNRFDPSVTLSASVFEWIKTGMKKVCLGIDSEDALLELVHRARRIDLPVYTVRDAGHTEIPAGTITCAAFGPCEDERVDPITGDLKLL